MTQPIVEVFTDQDSPNCLDICRLIQLAPRSRVASRHGEYGDCPTPEASTDLKLMYYRADGIPGFLESCRVEVNSLSVFPNLSITTGSKYLRWSHCGLWVTSQLIRSAGFVVEGRVRRQRSAGLDSPRQNPALLARSKM